MRTTKQLSITLPKEMADAVKPRFPMGNIQAEVKSSEMDYES